MIRQSSVYQESINLKTQTENDFRAIKRVCASICLSLISNDFIYTFCYFACMYAVHAYTLACMCLFNLLYSVSGCTRIATAATTLILSTFFLFCLIGDTLIFLFRMFWDLVIWFSTWLTNQNNQSKKSKMLQY